MLTAQVADHLPAILELIQRKTFAAVQSIAVELADDYKSDLQAVQAPEHSALGEIPHRYFGHRPGGYGPLFGDNEINNRPESGFASVQADYLASYIEGEAVEFLGEIEGYVGFAPSHVVTREQNYLLEHDQHGRPWVDEILDRHKQEIAEAAADAFRDAE
jgi:hypothetical protein